jgi:hypothetical protein
VVVELDCQPIVYLCRKSTDLSWEGVAEAEAAPPIEESAPASQFVPEALATEAVLPEASVVEGKYSAEAVVLLKE